MQYEISDLMEESETASDIEDHIKALSELATLKQQLEIDLLYGEHGLISQTVNENAEMTYGLVALEGIEELGEKTMAAIKRVWAAIYDIFLKAVAKIAKWLGIRNTAGIAVCKKSVDDNIKQTEDTLKSMGVPNGKVLARRLNADEMRAYELAKEKLKKLKAEAKKAKPKDIAEASKVASEMIRETEEVVQELSIPEVSEKIAAIKSKDPRLAILGGLSKLNDVLDTPYAFLDLSEYLSDYVNAIANVVSVYVDMKDEASVDDFLLAYRVLREKASSLVRLNKDGFSITDSVNVDVVNKHDNGSVYSAYLSVIKSKPKSKATSLPYMSKENYDQLMDKEIVNLITANSKLSALKDKLTELKDLLGVLRPSGDNSMVSREMMIRKIDTPEAKLALKFLPQLHDLLAKKLVFMNGLSEVGSELVVALSSYPVERSAVA